jgi:hypothetical protein
LLFVVTGANRHDSVSLDVLLKGMIVNHPNETTPNNLCLDAAYVGKEQVAKVNGFVSHIRSRGEEKKLIEKDPNFKARRWVVELSHSWFNRFRKYDTTVRKNGSFIQCLDCLSGGDDRVEQGHGYS